MQTHNHKAYSEVFEELCSHVLGLLFLVTVAAVRMRSKSGRTGRYYRHIKTITSGTGLYKHILKYYMPVHLMYNFVTCSQTSSIFLVHESPETKKTNLNLGSIKHITQDWAKIWFILLVELILHFEISDGYQFALYQPRYQHSNTQPD